ncbi:hypothetical protein [Nitrosospira sp. Is2]|uniref:hypothetical protein n=1 Tax=Nitrosospira sp. Is2 TaxID=3080532 RepID=UPI0029550CDE|nr:hypothetical protein [Nitrosospira sp. Is2]WON72512.1 hypothetical protein R5L00_08300 [Nitrosospira sp. Is2]
MRGSSPGRLMTRYVILGIISFMISGVTSAQIIIAEQQSDSAPWLLDKTAKPMPGEKDEAKTPERMPAEKSSSTSAGQEVSADSSSSSGWLPSQGYGSCRHSAPDQEDFFCTLGRILFGSTPSGPNRDVDENISAGGAGG